jgi:two-component system, OmpR family, phosphate regulon sensor histidine kinase PhoR
MMLRSAQVLRMASLGGAAVLAVSAVALAGALPLAAAPWLLLGGAVLIGVVGSRVASLVRHSEDESRRHRAEMSALKGQLQQQLNRIDALAEGLDVAIFICDERAQVLYSNSRARDLFRFEQPRGRSVLAVTLSHELEDLVLQAARRREPVTEQVTFTYPEERVGVAHTWVMGDDEPKLFLTVYDITDLRRLERARTDFVANVSHELRTPLSVIRAMSETLLDEGGHSDLATRYLNKIITEVDRLSMITQDLLVLSAAESNPVRKQVCDIADVFQTAVNQLTPKAREKGLELAYAGPEGQLIEANQAQMLQVAINLVDNAIKYTTTGRIDVELRAGEDEVVIEVRDTGIGIAEEHHSRIFERFYRVDKGRSRATGGTGLGLSIVKHLVEGHGGTIEIDSMLNQGTNFIVRLPVGEIGIDYAS